MIRKILTIARPVLPSESLTREPRYQQKSFSLVAVMALGAMAIAAFGLAPGPAPLVAAETAQDVAAADTEPVAAARRQAQSLHEAMHAALQIVHHQYFREDEGVAIPAEVLKGVFAELQQRQGVTLRWLVVQGQAMNSDHKPQDAFETAAVRALKRGAASHETVADGVYRRAGPITLGNDCLKCHVPGRTTNEDRTAGLLISIPLQPQ